MKLKLAHYNMEWMKDLFEADGTPKNTDAANEDDRQDAERSKKLAEVVRAIDPDVLCIVEGPDTLKNGTKTASGQLIAWRDLHALSPDYQAVHGIPSGGQQELCALYRSTKVQLVHDPEGRESKHPFDEPFLVDTTDSLIKESYKHYRPPLELSVRAPGGQECGRLMVVHAKSKGIFDAVDMARFEQLSERNRKKLFAECYSVRERLDQWFKERDPKQFIIVGDINDGFGPDYYEQRFARSAVEILLGDVWHPDRIMRHVLPKPRLGKYGWSPSSSRFRDKLTGDEFNVLIDHVLVSQKVAVGNALVWNPYLPDAPQQVKNLRTELNGASDHYPVSVELTLQ